MQDFRADECPPIHEDFKFGVRGVSGLVLEVFNIGDIEVFLFNPIHYLVPKHYFASALVDLASLVGGEACQRLTEERCRQQR